MIYTGVSTADKAGLNELLVQFSLTKAHQKPNYSIVIDIRAVHQKAKDVPKLRQFLRSRS